MLELSSQIQVTNRLVMRSMLLLIQNEHAVFFVVECRNRLDSKVKVCVFTTKCRRKEEHDMHKEETRYTQEQHETTRQAMCLYMQKKTTQVGHQNRVERGKETDVDVVYIQKNHADSR